MGGHLVRCRGGAWRIGFQVEQEGWKEAFARWSGAGGCPDAGDEKIRLRWNATAGATVRDSPWPSRPGWLPIAWLCCEADPPEGPGLAAAILDAEPWDDAPALIACDWLEERGARGRLFRIIDRHRNQPRMIADIPLDWARDPRPSSRSPAPYRSWAGPLHTWCRALVADRCVGCGGRRDGEDRGKWIAPPPCPLCGLPALRALPPLAIPSAVPGARGIDHAAARALVNRYLSAIPRSGGFGWVVDDEGTQEYDVGWLFSWTRADFLRRERRPPMAGNCPIFAHREDGALYMWAMHEPLARFLERVRHDRGSLRRAEDEPGRRDG